MLQFHKCTISLLFLSSREPFLAKRVLLNSKTINCLQKVQNLHQYIQTFEFLCIIKTANKNKTYKPKCLEKNLLKGVFKDL